MYRIVSKYFSCYAVLQSEGFGVSPQKEGHSLAANQSRYQMCHEGSCCFSSNRGLKPVVSATPMQMCCPSMRYSGTQGSLLVTQQLVCRTPTFWMLLAKSLVIPGAIKSPKGCWCCCFQTTTMAIGVCSQPLRPVNPSALSASRRPCRRTAARLCWPPMSQAGRYPWGFIP